MAIAGVGSVAASLSDGLAREGRTLLGGDVAFSLIQREAKPEEVAFLRSRGEVSVAATLRAMARSGDGRLALVELKAVDANYPMLGADARSTNASCGLLAQRDGAFGAAADPTLLARLDLKLGDRVTIGNATFQIRSVGRGRAGQARRRRRLRSALPDQRSGAARDRAVAARQLGALDLPAENCRTMPPTTAPRTH